MKNSTVIKKIIVFVISVAIFTACNRPLKNSESSKLIQFTEDIVLFPKEKIHCEYIPLETNDECLIGYMSRVELFEDRFYISDIKQHALLVYDITGKFITQIGSKGSGPSQYTAFTQFSIDKENRKILIDDVERLRLLCFDLDSYNFIFSKPVSFWRSSFEILPEDHYIWFSKIGTEQSKQQYYFCLTDSLLKPLHSYYKAFFKSPVSLSIIDNFIYTIQEKLFLYHSLAPYIYEVTGKEMEIHYEFAFPHHSFPPLSFLQEISTDWNSYLDKLMRSEYIACWGVNETNNMICITYQVKKDFFIAFYDKKMDRTYWYPMDKFTKRSGFEVPLIPIGNTEDCILFQIPFSTFSQYNKENPDLLKLKKQITEESNPVLCLMRLKTN